MMTDIGLVACWSVVPQQCVLIKALIGIWAQTPMGLLTAVLV